MDNTIVLNSGYLELNISFVCLYLLWALSAMSVMCTISTMYTLNILFTMFSMYTTCTKIKWLVGDTDPYRGYVIRRPKTATAPLILAMQHYVRPERERQWYDSLPGVGYITTERIALEWTFCYCISNLFFSVVFIVRVVHNVYNEYNVRNVHNIFYIIMYGYIIYACSDNIPILSQRNSVFLIVILYLFLLSLCTLSTLYTMYTKFDKIKLEIYSLYFPKRMTFRMLHDYFRQIQNKQIYCQKSHF